MILRFHFGENSRAVAEYLSRSNIELRPFEDEPDFRFYARVVYFAHCEAHERGDTVSLRGDVPGPE